MQCWPMCVWVCVSVSVGVSVDGVSVWLWIGGECKGLLLHIWW